LEDILAFFIGLDDPLPEHPRPEPPPGEQAEELVGTWAWDEDDSFIYIFYADGQGRRGFSPTLHRFTWSTTNDGLTIVMDGPAIPGFIAAEEWSYVIDGNILTITNRQIPDIIFSYIRQ